MDVWLNTDANGNNRWTLMYSGDTHKYVLTEQWRTHGFWTARNRSSWDTLMEALDHIKATNEQRIQEQIGGQNAG